MPFTPAATSGTRPIAFLGLAGVVHLDDAPAVPVRTVHVSAWGWWAREVAVPEATARQVAELAAWTDVVWISEWGHNAHTAFAAALNLPDRPWPTLPVQFDKLAAVRAYAADLPWIWIDDPLVVPTTPTDDALVLADTHDELATPPDSGRGQWTGSNVPADLERGVVEPADSRVSASDPGRGSRLSADLERGLAEWAGRGRDLDVSADPGRGLGEWAGWGRGSGVSADSGRGLGERVGSRGSTSDRGSGERPDLGRGSRLSAGSGRGLGEWAGTRAQVDSGRGVVERTDPGRRSGVSADSERGLVERGVPARPRRGTAGVAGGSGGVARGLRGLVVATDPRRGLAGVDLVAIRGQLTGRNHR